ncbi:Crp/Fnr family transcriptional regulator [Enterococcus faecalis]
MERDIFLEQIQLNGLCSKIYKKGDIIVSYWKNNYSSLFLEAGILKMTSDSAEGTIFNLHHIKGEVLVLSTSIFNDKVMCKYNLEVVSDTVKLYFLTADQLNTFMSKSKSVMMYVINCLQKQLTFLWSKICDFSLNGKCGAISGQLLSWVYLFGKKTVHNEIVIELATNLQELGNSCGIAHVSSVSRLLSDLKKEGVIIIKRGKLKILNIDSLKAKAPKIEEWYFLCEREKWNEINL